MLTAGTAVLFVMPPGGMIPHFAEHLGIAFLRTMLWRAGIPAQQYLPVRNAPLPVFARFLVEHGPRVVGFTAYETNLRICRAMARVVRETLPEAIIAVGGPNATFSPEETLDLLHADLCLRGAGEGTIIPIIQAILGTDRPRRRLPDQLAGIPNLVIRTPDGAACTRTGDLSSFPSEHFRCLDDIPSPYQAGLIATSDVGVLTARGCNQHCTYCSFAAISGRRVQYHSVERVLDDLAAFRQVVTRAGLRSPAVAISDDAFTLAPQRAREICEGIIGRGLQMPFSCETRADRVDSDLLRLMKHAGFVEVSFGLESAVPRVLRAIGKVQDPTKSDDPGFEAERVYLETVRRAVDAAKAAGLEPSVSVIGGLPEETDDDFRATLAFVESLRVSSYSHNVLALFPGTPLHRDRKRHGLDAGRDADSGFWWTDHSFDVRSIRPLSNSMTQVMQKVEAKAISDALCGRPSIATACDGAWAAVLHGARPIRGMAAWLREALTVHGAVVVVNAARPCDPSDAVAWFRILNRADVPWGLFALLSPVDGSNDPLVLHSLGSQGEHRFEIHATWPAGRCAIEVDEAGHCRVPVWLASAAVAPPPTAGDDGLFYPAPQIADGCRWWSGWRRCLDPRVLHVWPDSTVSPCWHGPAIGAVGDTYGVLVARARALRPAAGHVAPPEDHCPLGKATAEDLGVAIQAEDYEVAAQLAWLL